MITKPRHERARPSTKMVGLFGSNGRAFCSVWGHAFCAAGDANWSACPRHVALSSCLRRWRSSLDSIVSFLGAAMSIGPPTAPHCRYRSSAAVVVAAAAAASFAVRTSLHMHAPRLSLSLLRSSGAAPRSMARVRGNRRCQLHASKSSLDRQRFRTSTQFARWSCAVSIDFRSGAPHRRELECRLPSWHDGAVSKGSPGHSRVGFLLAKRFPMLHFQCLWISFHRL